MPWVWTWNARYAFEGWTDWGKSYTICMSNGGSAAPNMAKSVSANNGECCFTSYDYLLLPLETIKSIIQLHIVYCT